MCVSIESADHVRLDEEDVGDEENKCLQVNWDSSLRIIETEWPGEIEIHVYLQIWEKAQMGWNGYNCIIFFMV